MSPTCATEEASKNCSASITLSLSPSLFFFYPTLRIAGINPLLLGNNGGVGGSCQVGCLLYTFEGGRGDAPFLCDGFDCRACGTVFDPPTCQTCCKSLVSLQQQRIAAAANASTNTGVTIVDDGLLSGAARLALPAL